MQRLSVVIITHNEERHIGRCLDSVSKVADEVIVMDSFSTDRTASIAKEKQALFHQQTFLGYGAQKNAAAALASHTHILFLDADELLSEELQRNILDEKQKGFSFDGYTMNRLNNYCGQWIRHGSWYPDKKLRLIHRDKGNWNDRPVHESIDMRPDARIMGFKGNLLHHAYASFGEHLEKNNRYSLLSAAFMQQLGKRGSLTKIVFNPLWTFISCYIIKLGFLDGLYGFVIAISVAHLTFSKHVRLYQLQRGLGQVEDK